MEMKQGRVIGAGNPPGNVPFLSTGIASDHTSPFEPARNRIDAFNKILVIE